VKTGDGEKEVRLVGHSDTRAEKMKKERKRNSKKLPT